MKVRVRRNLAKRLLNHGPAVLVTSFYRGRPNVATIAWTMPLDSDPPKVALVIRQIPIAHIPGRHVGIRNFNPVLVVTVLVRQGQIVDGLKLADVRVMGRQHDARLKRLDLGSTASYDGRVEFAERSRSTSFSTEKSLGLPNLTNHLQLLIDPMNGRVNVLVIVVGS